MASQILYFVLFYNYVICCPSKGSRENIALTVVLTELLRRGKLSKVFGGGVRPEP